jgi:hypothetical protein
MPTVLIELPGGAGVVCRDDGEIVITQDVSDDRGHPLRRRDDCRPAQTWLDDVRSILAGLLPPRAVSAEVVDDRGTRVAATVGGGVYAAILEQPNDGHEAVDEDEAAKTARIARHRAEARVQKWYSDTMTLRGVTFPIYAAETWPATINGSGSSGDDLTELTVGHHAAENDEPFTAPDLSITTSIREAHDTDLRRARQALEMWVHDDHNRPQSERSL